MLLTQFFLFTQAGIIFASSIPRFSWYNPTARFYRAYRLTRDERWYCFMLVQTPNKFLQTGGMEPNDIWNIEDLDLAPQSYAMHLQMSVFFNASHQIEYKPGKFGEMHRHSFQLTAKAAYDDPSDGNYYVPFEDFRAILRQIALHYEGRCLNDFPIFRNMQSTTENLVQVIAYQIEQLTRHLPLEILEITLNESPTIGVTLVSNDRKNY